MNPIDDDYIFGACLREERERLGLQLHELSLKAGRTHLQQKRMEAGKTPINIDYLQATERFTDVDVGYLITGGGVDQHQARLK